MFTSRNQCYKLIELFKRNQSQRSVSNLLWSFHNYPLVTFNNIIIKSVFLIYHINKIFLGSKDDNDLVRQDKIWPESPTTFPRSILSICWIIITNKLCKPSTYFIIDLRFCGRASGCLIQIYQLGDWLTDFIRFRFIYFIWLTDWFCRDYPKATKLPDKDLTGQLVLMHGFKRCMMLAWPLQFNCRFLREICIFIFITLKLWLSGCHFVFIILSC